MSKILSILRVETNGADATSLRKVLNIMGVILDDIQGDINSINFQYDYTPIDSEIAYLENVIIEALSAYNQFDALQAMGDRASAAESGMAQGAIAQGLATHQKAIMRLYGDIARQCLANRVVYSAKQEFPVYNAGGYSSLTIQQMATVVLVDVKSRMAKDIHEKTTAANAMAIASNFKDMLTPVGIAYFIEQAMLGQAPRKMIASFIQKPGASKEEVAVAQQQAQNQAEMLRQNQQAYESNPTGYEVQNVMQNATPGEIDQILSSMTSGGASAQQGGGIEPDTSDISEATPDILDMPEQEGAMALDMEGMTPELGSQLANPNGNI